MARFLSERYRCNCNEVKHCQSLILSQIRAVIANVTILRISVLDDFDLNAFLPYQLSVLAARVSNGFSELYRQKFGITIPEWRVVAHLSQAGAVSVREIHQRVDMDKSKVSRAASRLETAGYVSKRINGTDRRLVELELTPKGRKMIDELTPIAREYEAQVLAGLGDQNQGFRAALETLLKEKAKT